MWDHGLASSQVLLQRGRQGRARIGITVSCEPTALKLTFGGPPTITRLPVEEAPWLNGSRAAAFVHFLIPLMLKNEWRFSINTELAWTMLIPLYPTALCCCRSPDYSLLRHARAARDQARYSPSVSRHQAWQATASRPYRRYRAGTCGFQVAADE